MEVVEIKRDLLEQANNVATLGEYFAWMQRCYECIERLEVVPSFLGCQLEIDNLWWPGSCDSRVQNSIAETFYTFWR